MTDEEKRQAEEKAKAEREAKVKELLAQAKELGLVALTQDRLDGLIDEGYKRGAKNSAEAKRITDLEKELEALRAQKARGGDPGKTKTENADDLEARIKQLNEQWEQKLHTIEEKATKAEQQRAEEAQKHRRERLRSRVLAAAGGKEVNAHNPDQFYKLMESDGLFKFDEEAGDWIVVNEKGQIRIDANAGGQNMTVESAVREYAEKNAHLRRASGRAGSGQADGQASNDREALPPPKGLEGETLTPSQVYANRHAIVQHISQGGRIGRVGSHNVQ